MGTITIRDGVKQADFEAALAAYQDNPTAENELAALTLYQKMTGFNPGCAECLIKRKQFLDGLKAVSRGDTLEGMAGVANSIRGAVAINLRKIFM